MAAPPFRSGDFVWTRFPFEDQPDRPAENRHIACVMACFSRNNAVSATTSPVDHRGLVIGVYTSSQVRKFGDALPIGVIQVKQDQASRSGNTKPFFIDVRKRAFVPFTSTYFPDMDLPQHGCVGSADRTLFAEIIRQYRLVNEKHPELIVNVGPLRSR